MRSLDRLQCLALRTPHSVYLQCADRIHRDPSSMRVSYGKFFEGTLLAMIDYDYDSSREPFDERGRQKLGK